LAFQVGVKSGEWVSRNNGAICLTKRCSLLKNSIAELFREEKHRETHFYEANSQ
jgi:hypothetical protein